MKRLLIPVAMVFASAHPNLAQNGADHPEPRVVADVPIDVEIPAGFAGNPIAFFDDYSWRTFIALSWPAENGARGAPDRNKAFGTAADDVVWGTFKADHELFQPGGMPPSPWDSFDAISPDPLMAFKAAKVLKVLGGFGPRASELQIDHFNQAGPGSDIGSLTSRNRHYVRYEIRMNRTHYDFLRDDEFYLFENLPTEGQLVFPTGAIEIKAAWRRFTEEELADAALLERFYIQNAVLVDPDDTRLDAKVGLVGLHIVHRTPSRPEWIWSTFEHLDNDEGNQPTFQQAAQGEPANILQPVVNQGQPPLPDPDPVKVRREKPTHNSTAETNRIYRSHPAIRDTVWANYRLVMTQWPVRPAQSDAEFVTNFTRPYPVGAGAPFPADDGGTAISNLTMETTGVFQRSFSCMKCHFLAGVQRHTEFVWTVPLRAWRPPGEDASSDADALRLNARRILEAAGMERQQ